jgi:hypothetical protein
MAIATGTALALGLGAASAGTSLLGAKKASTASKQAAATQQQASRDALNYLTGITNQITGQFGPGSPYEAQNRALFAPYVRMGTDSLSNLYKGMGMGPMPNYPPQQMPMNVGGGPPPGAGPWGGAVAGGAQVGQRLMPRPVGAPVLMPGRALGGPVNVNQPYVVGEQGPEVFVPNQSGMIAPNRAQRFWGTSTPLSGLYNFRV